MLTFVKWDCLLEPNLFIMQMFLLQTIIVIHMYFHKRKQNDYFLFTMFFHICFQIALFAIYKIIKWVKTTYLGCMFFSGTYTVQGLQTFETCWTQSGVWVEIMRSSNMYQINFCWLIYFVAISPFYMGSTYFEGYRFGLDILCEQTMLWHKNNYLMIKYLHCILE